MPFGPRLQCILVAEATGGGLDYQKRVAGLPTVCEVLVHAPHTSSFAAQGPDDKRGVTIYMQTDGAGHKWYHVPEGAEKFGQESGDTECSGRV